MGSRLITGVSNYFWPSTISTIAFLLSYCLSLDRLLTTRPLLGCPATEDGELSRGT